MKAKDCSNAPFYKEAVNNMFSSVMENNTWILTDLPLGYNPTVYKWVFKKKMRPNGSIEKHK